jgi:hypothetical protein
LRGDIDQMGDDESDYETEQRLDRMERLAVGLVQYLERTSGIDRAEFRLNWYAAGNTTRGLSGRWRRSSQHEGGGGPRRERHRRYSRR